MQNLNVTLDETFPVTRNRLPVAVKALPNRALRFIMATMKLKNPFFLGLLITSGVAFAHHSSVMFDNQKEVTVMGTVKEFNFDNPHVSIITTVTDDKGVTKDWSFEAASVRGMVQAGWRRSTLKPGDSVTIVGHPLRDGRPGAQLVRAVLADGTVLKNNVGGNY
jgi:Family of unknown function (DUF6152)